VVVGQSEPVEQRADAHQRHAEPVRSLRFLWHDQRHFRVPPPVTLPWSLPAAFVVVDISLTLLKHESADAYGYY